MAHADPDLLAKSKFLADIADALNRKGVPRPTVRTDRRPPWCARPTCPDMDAHRRCVRCRVGGAQIPVGEPLGSPEHQSKPAHNPNSNGFLNRVSEVRLLRMPRT